ETTHDPSENASRISQSREDYPKAIFILSRSGEVRKTDIAEYVGVSKPSVTRATAALSLNGCITTDSNLSDRAFPEKNP
ncbi:MAG: MarR family transcriptional regulator, partial [Clostridiales Family XIII bacterium]|nr:MarR family transcriptional regulator [Clostridiales Family XIII bacterium]